MAASKTGEPPILQAYAAFRPIGIWNAYKIRLPQPRDPVGVPELRIFEPSLVFQIRNVGAVEPNLPTETTTKVSIFLQPFQS